MTTTLYEKPSLYDLESLDWEVLLSIADDARMEMQELRQPLRALVESAVAAMYERVSKAAKERGTAMYGVSRADWHYLAAEVKRRENETNFYGVFSKMAYERMARCTSLVCALDVSYNPPPELPELVAPEPAPEPAAPCTLR